MAQNKERMKLFLRLADQLNAHLYVEHPRHFVDTADSSSYWHRYFQTRHSTQLLRSCKFCNKNNIPTLSTNNLWGDVRYACKKQGSFLLKPQKCPGEGVSLKDAKKLNGFSCKNQTSESNILGHSKRIENAAQFLMSALECSKTNCVLVIVDSDASSQTAVKRAKECQFEHSHFSKTLLWLNDNNVWVKRRMRSALKEGLEQVTNSEFIDLHERFQKRFPELDSTLVLLTLDELALHLPTVRVQGAGAISC